MIYFYRLFILLAVRPLLLLWYRLNPKALSGWIRLREQRPQWPELKSCYWLHASSGELEYGKALIRLIKKNNPEQKIVLTYSSPSAEKLFADISDSVDFFIPLCWDTPEAVSDFIHSINPELMIFIKTDLWPEVIHQLQSKKIPLYLLAYAPKMNWSFRFFTAQLLKKFSYISCLDTSLKEKIQIFLPDTRIGADGDSRFDQVFHRLAQPAKTILKKTKKLLVAGSTWPEDEAALLPALSELRTDYHIVLCPHDVKRSNVLRLRNELAALGLESDLFSDVFKTDSSIEMGNKILLIDQVGFLADCYRTADSALIGGSFRARTHSVMEALCCGCGVVVGPHYLNNAEATRYLHRYVLSVSNSSELKSALRQLSQLKPDDIVNEMRKNQNASERFLQALLKNQD